MERTELFTLSILCLTYNHEGFITDALEGFFKQNYKGLIQLVIHDDNSTDNTIDIIEAYCNIYMPKNFELNLIKREKNCYSQGLPVLSLALSGCTGKYVAFCEGDDVWMDENKLTEQIDFLESNEDYSVVYSNFQPFDENGLRKVRVKKYKDYSTYELGLIPQIFPLTACFKNVIKMPVECDVSPYGDIFIWAMLAQHGKGKFILSKKPPKYRMHSQGLSSLVNEDSRTRSQIISYGLLMRFYQRSKDYEREQAIKEIIEKIVIGRYIKNKLPIRLLMVVKRVVNGIRW